ncbi:MAG TPA: ATP-binding protein [Dongiaceae bacterium]|jgi:PAS domain S-box-containing protein|nr:ATP-binding protein [Dongiaceae bacterium]
MTGISHSLLKRQLKRCFGSTFAIPTEWQAFIANVNAAYLEFDLDREMLERSLELSSQELMQANAEMRAVFQAIPDLLFHITFDGTILSCRGGQESALLLPAEALCDRRIQDVPDPVVGAKFREAIARVAAERATVSIEYSIAGAEGNNVCEARLLPLPQDEIVVIIRNITARKKAEQVQSAVYRISEAAQTAPNLDDLFRSLHNIVRELMPQPARNFYIALHDAEYDEVRFCYHVDEHDPRPAPRRGGQGLTEYVLRTGKPLLRTPELGEELRRRGEAVLLGTMSVDWLGVPLKTQQGQPFGVMAVHTYTPTCRLGKAEQEILEFVANQVAMAITRKQAETALQAAELKYRSIFENAVEGMYQSSPEGRFLAVNPALAHIAGYATPEAMVNEITSIDTQLFADPVRCEEFKRQLAQTGVVRGFEFQAYRRDGSIFWASQHARVIRDDAGELLHYEGSIEDVTAHKQLEAQFLQSQKMEAFGQLAGGVAHDFNNILTIIQGNVSLLKSETTPAERTTALDEIAAAADRAANLTRQLLTFSHRRRLQPRPLDLNEVVANITKMLQRLIGEHIVLEARHASGGALVQADPSMLEQVLINLAVNSRDAMPKGGRLVIQTETVMFEAAAGAANPHRQPGNFVRLRVTDTGSGINPQHLPHIFEPFFTTKEIGKGTGLGLATVFSIVQQHHGWIEVESRPEIGTSFAIYLPQLPQGTITSRQTAKPAPVRGGTETILLVEDETAVRHLLRQSLSRHGYTVLEADTGKSALRHWHRQRDKIQLLITDMVMPGGMSGSDLATLLLQDRNDLKVIYCSGYTDAVLGKASPLRTNPNFLEKPFDPAVLLQKVRECLDRA